MFRRQYVGNLDKIENGIVVVTAYGMLEGMNLSLTFEVYKPKARLKKNDTYYSKPEIAASCSKNCANTTSNGL